MGGGECRAPSPGGAPPREVQGHLLGPDLMSPGTTCRPGPWGGAGHTMDGHHLPLLLPGQRGAQGPTTESSQMGSQTPAPPLGSLLGQAWRGAHPRASAEARAGHPMPIDCLLEAWGLRETAGRRAHRAAQPAQQGSATSQGEPRVPPCDGPGFLCLNVGQQRPRVCASACPLTASAGLPSSGLLPSACLQPGPLLRTPSPALSLGCWRGLPPPWLRGPLEPLLARLASNQGESEAEAKA